MRASMAMLGSLVGSAIDKHRVAQFEVLKLQSILEMKEKKHKERTAYTLSFSSNVSLKSRLVHSRLKE